MAGTQGNKPDKAELDRVRKLVDIVVLRALADPKIREQLKSDPAAVLEKAGVPAQAVEDITRELVIDGFRTEKPCSQTCFFFTCIWSCGYTGQ